MQQPQEQQQQSDQELQIKLRTKQDLQSVYSQKYQVFLLVTIFSLFCVLFNSYIQFGWDYKIVIVYCCTAQFVMMISKLLSNKGLNTYCCFTIIDSILLIVYLLSLVYNKEVSKININFIAYALLVIQFIILALTVLMSKSTIEGDNQDQSKQIYEIFQSALKSIGSLQIVFVTLKWTKQIDWSWTQTFVIVWFCVGTLFLVEICCFIDLIIKICNKKLENKIIQSNVDLLQVHGSLWINLLFFGIVSQSLLTFLGLSLLLDQNIRLINLYAFILSLSYYGVQLLYYCKNKESIIQFINLIDFQQIQQNVEIEQNSIKGAIKKLHRVSMSKLPQFMIRLSATYYKKVESKTSNQQIVKGLQEDKKVRSVSFQVLKKKENLRKSPSFDLDEDVTKRFDHLLSSPRLKLEVSESLGIAPELSSRIGSIKPNSLCLVCYEKESNIINQPCGHGGLCQECSEQLFSKTELCYLCRKVVTHTLIVQDIQNKDNLVEVLGVGLGQKKK